MTPAVAYSSSFIPPEWIAAHGLVPARLTPEVPGPYDSSEAGGVCPFAHAFTLAAESAGAAGLVFATTCDQMRRSVETGGLERPPRFLFNIPATWETPAAHRLYRDELRRLGRFLETLGGRPPAPAELRDTMARFEAAREELLAGRAGRSSRAQAERIAGFQRTSVVPDPDAHVPNGRRKTEKPRATPPLAAARPLMLLGSPLRAGDFGLLDLIDAAGGRIVVDATEYGEREWPRSFDRRAMRDDPFEELADAYFGHIPAVFRRPNSALYLWLRDALRRTPVRGIVFTTHPWCDLWVAELARLREWSPVPVLALDLAGGGRADVALATRIQAFMEMPA